MFAMYISRRSMLAASSGALLGPSWVWADDGLDHIFTEVTQKSEEAARRGTSWLMKTMHRDGGCCPDIGQPADIGCTAMIGLALPNW